MNSDNANLRIECIVDSSTFAEYHTNASLLKVFVNILTNNQNCIFNR